MFKLRLVLACLAVAGLSACLDNDLERGLAGPRVARLSPTRSAAIRSPVPSQAVPRARCATNSPIGAADLTASGPGARLYPTAAPGHARGGGLAFEGP